MSTAAVAAALTIASCSGGRSAADQLREADLAIAEGDMTAARSVANRLLGASSADANLSARELAHLSIIYMHMAEEENDNTALVATAADLYRRAFRENSDSARAYYSSLSADNEATATLLHHIVAATDSATVIPDDIHPDSII